jgi:hypothetical protein
MGFRWTTLVPLSPLFPYGRWSRRTRRVTGWIPPRTVRIEEAKSRHPIPPNVHDVVHCLKSMLRARRVADRMEDQVSQGREAGVRPRRDGIASVVVPACRRDRAGGETGCWWVGRRGQTSMLMLAAGPALPGACSGPRVPGASAERKDGERLVGSCDLVSVLLGPVMGLGHLLDAPTNTGSPGTSLM